MKDISDFCWFFDRLRDEAGLDNVSVDVEHGSGLLTVYACCGEESIPCGFGSAFAGIAAKADSISFKPDCGETRLTAAYGSIFDKT